MELSSFIIPKKKDSLGASLWWLVYNTVLARYEYEGITDNDKIFMECDSIERALMHSGMCAIFENGGKLVALPAVLTDLNIYGRPSEVTAYAYASVTDDGINMSNAKTFTSGLKVGKDCTLIYNNSERVSSIAMIMPYLKRLDKIWCEAGRNINMSRVMGMIAGNSAMANAFKTAYDEMLEKGASVLSVGSSMADFMKNFEKLDFNVEYTPDKYHQDFKNTWDMMFMSLGYETVAHEKRERLVTYEAEANKTLVDTIKNTTKRYRVEGLEQTNKLFGTNIKLKESDNNVPQEKGKVGDDKNENGRGDNE